MRRFVLFQSDTLHPSSSSSTTHQMEKYLRPSLGTHTRPISLSPAQSIPIKHPQQHIIQRERERRGYNVPRLSRLHHRLSSFFTTTSPIKIWGRRRRHFLSGNLIISHGPRDASVSASAHVPLLFFFSSSSSYLHNRADASGFLSIRSVAAENQSKSFL